MTTPVPIYTFSYDTPGTDAAGNPITTPNSFSLSGIALDVAKGILFGLNKVPTIQNVTAARTKPSVDVVTQQTAS